MRIFFIGQKGIPASYGGVEHHVEQLSTRLAKKGHEVFVYARPWYQSVNYPNSLSPEIYEGVHIITQPSINTKNLDAISATFLNTIHVLFQKVDIIHYHGIGPSSLLFLPRFLKSKAKVVATFHCKDYEHQKWSRFAQTYLKFGERICVTMPHGTITVSKTLQHYVENKYHKETIYIPNGVPIYRKAKLDELRSFGLEKDKYLLTVARLVKHKNIHHLIRAYKLIYPTPQANNPKLVVVGGPADGGGKYERELKKLAQNNPNIVFTGYQTGETLKELYSNTYLYIHPSASEGLPISVLEAMAYGKCVLVSNIPENLEPIADYGFSFKVGNVKDLSQKLEQLIHKPHLLTETGLKAREHVKKEYHWDDIVEKTDEFYENLYHHHPLHLHPREFLVHDWDQMTDMTEDFYSKLV